MENYVADSVQEQARFFPHFVSKKESAALTAHQKAAIGSAALLALLHEHHCYDVKVPVTAPVESTPIVLLPTEKTIEAIFDANPSIRIIVEEVAKFYNLTLNMIRADRRSNEIVRPRHVAIWLCRELTTHSFPTIGNQLGGRDHTTCINACRRVDQRLEREERLKDEIQIIKMRIMDRLMERAA